MSYRFSADTARGRAAIALLSCILCTPALFSGLVLDDYVIGLRVLDGSGDVRWRALLDGFAFVPPGHASSLREQGFMPWWTDSELAIQFFRPLAVLTHIADFAWFARAPWLMHLESLALLFGLNLSVGAWYARLMPSAPRALNLTYALYALSPGHGFAASWIANRSAVLAALLGVLALLAHHRERAGEGAHYRWLSTIALAASLLAGEIGTASLALLVAHAVCLDEAPFRARLRALAPALAIAALWLLAYRQLGYGVHASGAYLDAANDPTGYLRALATNLPLLWLAQWVLPVATPVIMMSRSLVGVLWVVSGLVLILSARALVSVLSHDRRARFAGLSTLLALLPAAATIPHDRLLIIADVGGLMLLVLTVEHAASRATRLGRALFALLELRLVVASLAMVASAASLFQYIEVAERPFERTLREPTLADQSLVVVNPPVAYLMGLMLSLRAFEGGPVPGRLRALAPGIYPLEVTRLDRRTLLVRTESGMFQTPGSFHAEGVEQLGPISQVYAAQRLNQMVRDRWRFAPGDGGALSDVDYEVVAVTAEGFPRAVRFRFAEPLEHARFRFVVWSGHELLPFALPAPGEQVQVAPILR